MREDKFLLAHEHEPRLTDALREFHMGLEIPDGEAAWERMRGRLQEEKPRQHWQYWIKLGIIAAGLTLLIHLMFWAVNPVQAIMKYYFEVYRGKDVTDISFGNYDMHETPAPGSMLTAPPPPEDMHGHFERGETQVLAPDETMAPPVPQTEALPGESNDRRFTVLEEAAPYLMFPVYAPAPVPEGYKLTDIRISLGQKEEKSGMADLTYWNEQTRKMINLTEMMSYDGKVGMSTTIGGGTTEVKEVSVNKHKGVLFQMGTFTELQWFTDTMFFTLSGQFTEKEIMKLAESINNHPD